MAFHVDQLVSVEYDKEWYEAEVIGVARERRGQTCHLVSVFFANDGTSMVIDMALLENQAKIRALSPDRQEGSTTRGRTANGAAAAAQQRLQPLGPPEPAQQQEQQEQPTLVPNLTNLAQVRAVCTSVLRECTNVSTLPCVHDFVFGSGSGSSREQEETLTNVSRHPLHSRPAPF
jgi:hypothetical protein